MATERYQYFEIAGHQLVLNITPHRYNVYILTELAACKIVTQEVLAEQEMYCTLELLQHYPTYAPYEALLASISASSLDQARAIVHQSLEQRTLDQALKPLRNILLRCRAILHAFSLTVHNVHGMGYMIVPR